MQPEEKNLYILIPNNEVHKRYFRMFADTLPNIGGGKVKIDTTEYHKKWYGDNIQIELKESVYLERKKVFDKMNAIVTENAEAFLKKFPHPKIEGDGNFFI